MKTFYIFDRWISGHHLEWLRHLALGAQGMPLSHFVFCVHKAAADSIPGADNIAIIPWEESARTTLLKAGTFASDLRWLGQQMRSAKGEVVLILPWMNPYQFALPLWRPPSNIHLKARGVLLSAPRASGNDARSNTLTRFRRVLQMRLLARMRKVEQVFFLNDATNARAWCTRLGTDKFQTLGDPCPTYQARLRVEDSKYRILIFGSLSERKGFAELWRGLATCQPKVVARFAVHLVGKINPQASSWYHEELQRARAALPMLEISLENRFVSEAEIPQIFSDIDLVALLYRNPEASTGVLGWAAACGRPVLAEAQGLLGDLVSRCRLGVTVRAEDSSGVGQMLECCLSGKHSVSESDQYAYCTKRTPLAFARQLLLDDAGPAHV